MVSPVLCPHENTAELSDDMRTLYGLLRQAGVFDGETGDQIHTIVARAHRVLRSLADELDPVHVSIEPVPRSDLSENDTVVKRASRSTTFIPDVLPDFLAAC